MRATARLTAALLLAVFALPAEGGSRQECRRACGSAVRSCMTASGRSLRACREAVVRRLMGVTGAGRPAPEEEL